MSGSQPEDYILREVRAVVAMLARIVGLRMEGDLEAATAELQRAYATLLGPQDHLLRRIDPSTAAILLGSPDKVLMLARLTAEEAEQQIASGRAGDPPTIRAIRLSLESVRGGGTAEAARPLLEDLLPRIDLGGLSAEERRMLESIVDGPGGRS